MSKLKKVLLMCTAYVLVAALAIGGTVAYLQDSDSDVNVMTLGNVKIEQHEYERVVENGAYKVENGSYVLKDFTQAKPLLPSAIPTNSSDWGWDTTLVDMSQVGSKGTMQVFKAGSNAQDKIVTVKNTGKSDAYVRTWIALEDPFTENRLGVNVGKGSYYTQTSWTTVEIDGVKYSVSCFTYKEALKPGEVSTPSLFQVYLNSKATNEDMELLGDTYEILAFSQAVQAAGFDSADAALDAAFGDNIATNHPWTDTTISSEVGITEAGTYDLKGDVYTIDSAYFHTQKVDAPVTINGNGATVEGIATSIDAFQWEGGTIPAMSAIFSSADGSKVTVNDLKFTGTMSSIMLGNYVNSTYNKFDTELNNVDVIGTEVVSFSANISPAVTVYGTAVLNNCNIYGTTLSELDTDPKWPVYDLALTNYTTTTLNNSKIGSIYMWNRANLTIDNNSEVDSIVVLNKVSNEFAITVKGGSTVGTIDLSKIGASCEDKVTITIEDGASVGAFVDNGVSYDTLDAWKAANN